MVSGADAARALASLRKRYTKVCALEGCGVIFDGTARKQYCSHQHATLAVMRRKRQRQRQDKAEAAERKPERRRQGKAQQQPAGGT